MTAPGACRFQLVIFFLLMVFLKEEEVSSESIVVTRFTNGDEFTNQDGCNSNWCTDHDGFCSSSCCTCKCSFQATYMIGKSRCVRDTSFLLDSKEGKLKVMSTFFFNFRCMISSVSLGLFASTIKNF